MDILTPPSAIGARAVASAHVPRVFICYAHDNEEHVESTREFARFLVRCGLDVHIDIWDVGQRKDWSLWAQREMTAADFVLVVASPMCRAVGDGQVPNLLHRGLQSELVLLREWVHSDRAGWLAKVLPIVLPGGTPDDIPAFLQPQTADHYLIESFTADGVGDLFKALGYWPVAGTTDVRTAR